MSVSPDYIRMMTLMPLLLPDLNRPRKCPVQNCNGVYLDTSGRIFRKPIVLLIVHLNDYHRWTREQVADWLETLDIDLAFKVGERS